MKQANVAITICLTYFPTDLDLDKNVSDKNFLQNVEADVMKVISEIEEATNLSVSEYDVEISE